MMVFLPTTSEISQVVKTFIIIGGGFVVVTTRQNTDRRCYCRSCFIFYIELDMFQNF